MSGVVFASTMVALAALGVIAYVVTVWVEWRDNGRDDSDGHGGDR